MNPTNRHHTIVAAATAAAVVLALASATVIVAVGGHRGRFRSRAFGTVSCTAPALRGKTVRVELYDHGNRMMGNTPMMASVRTDRGTVHAGQVSFVVYNNGALAHELVVLPMPADGPGTRAVGADGKVDETGSLGEASKSCSAGTGEGLSPGSTGWTTINLRPGRYELICNLPWHYAAGMFDVLTVN